MQSLPYCTFICKCTKRGVFNLGNRKLVNPHLYHTVKVHYQLTNQSFNYISCIKWEQNYIKWENTRHIISADVSVEYPSQSRCALRNEREIKPSNSVITLLKTSYLWLYMFGNSNFYVGSERGFFFLNIDWVSYHFIPYNQSAYNSHTELQTIYCKNWICEIMIV